MVRLDFEACRERIVGAGGGVIGERVAGMLAGVAFPMQLVLERSTQPAGLPGAPLGNRS